MARLMVIAMKRSWIMITWPITYNMPIPHINTERLTSSTPHPALKG